MVGMLRFLNHWVRKLETGMSWAAVVILAAMMGLVNANVFLRPLGMPVWGVFEVVGFLGALLISFSLIHPTLYGEHLSVDLVANRFPPKVRSLLSVIKTVFGMAVFGLIAWQTARYGFKIMASGQVSGTLKLPLSPILWGISAAFGVSTLVLLLKLFSRIFCPEEESP